MPQEHTSWDGPGRSKRSVVGFCRMFFLGHFKEVEKNMFQGKSQLR